jgi:heme A synthase
MGLAIANAIYIWRRHTDRSELASPALLLLILLLVQVTLGAAAVISRLEPWVNSVHVVCGALVLTTSLVITLRTWRSSLRIVDSGLRIEESGATESMPNRKSTTGDLRPIRNPQSAIRNESAS